MSFIIECRHKIVQVIIILVTLSAVNLRRTNESRIVGGVETTIDQVPYLINLQRNGQFTCGGSLISSKCVLTAAHCVYGSPASSFTVKAGASKLTDVGVTRQVQQSFVSTFYSPNTLDMDVAVLKLTEPLKGPHIAAIQLCHKQPGNNEFVQVSGWGVTSENNQLPSNQVRSVNVKVISREDCLQLYGDKAYLSSTMFCASVPGERDSCSGDSGGPVIYNGQLCGIVSWGFGCARKEFPGVYTNVASLRIKAFVNTIRMRNCM